MKKYEPLHDYLLKYNQDSIKISYKELESILSGALPDTAFKNKTWWANDKNGRHVQANAWLEAGWKVQDIILGQYVIFKKV